MRTTRLFLTSTSMILPVAALAAGLVGCTATTSSRNIRTAGIVAEVDITAERKDQALVETLLVVGGGGSNTRVVLEDGDRLFAEVDGQRQQLQAVGRGKYQARLPASQGEFVVQLERDGDDAALETRGVLPPPFEITSKFKNNPFSREKDGVTLTWTPNGADGEVEIALRGDCILTYRKKVGGNPGTFTVPAGQLRAWKRKADQTCNVTARITVTTFGTADPSLASDSRVRLIQTREARFASAP